jgi:hypothetical protein
LPYRVFDWEPVYLRAAYSDDGMVCDPPPAPSIVEQINVPMDPATVLSDAELTRAARQLIEPWLDSSNGRFEFAGVEGGPGEALQALGVPQQHARIARLAHGRRRGAAAGRFATWWFLATLGGFADEWPPDPEEIGELANELQWYWWDASEPAVGWRLQLLIHDPTDAVSWIINAADAAS